MTVVLVAPLLVAIVGLFLFFAFETKNPALSRVGFAMFWTGLLVTLFSISDRSVSFR